MVVLHPDTFQFLRDLAENNNREWFLANKKRYEAAKKNVLHFVEVLVAESTAIDPTLAGLDPKKCLFRINRDIRFSADKSPYKTNFGAFFNRGGKQNPAAGYYLNIQPDDVFFGGGWYMPEAANLKQIREEIDYNLPEFSGIITSENFKQFYGELNREESQTLKRPPKGYDADNPAIDFLKLKSVTATRSFSDAEAQSEAFLSECLRGVAALQPLVQFLNRSTENKE